MYFSVKPVPRLQSMSLRCLTSFATLFQEWNKQQPVPDLRDSHSLTPRKKAGLEPLQVKRKKGVVDLLSNINNELNYEKTSLIIIK